MARQQKAAAKAQKRQQKKQGVVDGDNTAEPEQNAETTDEFGQPAGLDFHDF